MPTYHGRRGRLFQPSWCSASVLSNMSPRKRTLQFCSAFYLDLDLMSEPFPHISFSMTDKDVCFRTPETLRTVWIMSLLEGKGLVETETCIYWFSKSTSWKKFLFTLCLFWAMVFDLCTEPLYAIAIETVSIASDSVIACEHWEILAGVNWLEINICKCTLRSLETKWFSDI